MADLYWEAHHCTQPGNIAKYEVNQIGTSVTKRWEWLSRPSCDDFSATTRRESLGPRYYPLRLVGNEPTIPKEQSHYYLFHSSPGGASSLGMLFSGR